MMPSSGYVSWTTLPDVCQSDACGHKEAATCEYKNTVYMARDPDLSRLSMARDPDLSRLSMARDPDLSRLSSTKAG